MCHISLSFYKRLIRSVASENKPKQNKPKKTYPGDCLATFNSIDLRNTILQKAREGKLIIDEKKIVVFRDIPNRFLKKRNGYKELTNTLNTEKIRFRWEYPEGVSFYYKEKKHKIRSELELKKFGRRYEELRRGTEEDEEEDEGEIIEEEQTQITVVN